MSARPCVRCGYPYPWSTPEGADRVYRVDLGGLCPACFSGKPPPWHVPDPQPVRTGRGRGGRRGGRHQRRDST